MNPERFGISQPHWVLITRLLLDPIAKAGGSVSVFGSRARGDYRPFSDLDLLVEGPIPRSLLSSISENLEESTLPFRVDVVFEPDLAEAYRAAVSRERMSLS